MKQSHLITKIFFLSILLSIQVGCVSDDLEGFKAEELIEKEENFDQPLVASFTSSASSGNEGAVIDIPIKLNRSATGPVEIQAIVTPMDATPDVDYSIVTDRIIIGSGQKAGLIRLFLLADSFSEEIEQFKVQMSLMNFTAGMGSISEHTVSIMNKKADNKGDAKISFANANSSVSEAVGTYNIPLLLDKPATKDITLKLELGTGGNATMGSDFNLPSTTINIAKDASSAIIPVSVINDTDLEGPEKLVLNIASITGADEGTFTLHELSLIDDEVPAGGVQDELTAFTETLYNNVLRNSNAGQCLNCHRPNGTLLQVSPAHSHDDPAQALQLIKTLSLVSLNDPGSSRLVRKIQGGHRNIPTSVADDIRFQIQMWSSRLAPPSTGGNNSGGATPPPTNRIASRAMLVAEGRAVEGTPRFTQHQIAFYDFKRGPQADIIYDKSGAAPALDLKISGDLKWLPGQGIKCNESGAKGKGLAIASREASTKLHTTISSGRRPTNQYTLEAWITSATANQDGPSRIITYSNGTSRRNFMMGQQNEYYAFRNRNDDTDQNGEPRYEPQKKFVSNDRPVNHHVVMTYDGKTRRLYINGSLVDVKDPKADSALKALSSWDPSYRFVICNETSRNRAFQGSVYLAAVHSRALTAAQIQQNFDAGFAKKVAMDFDLSEHAGPGARVSVQVEIQGKYLIFDKPEFKGLNNPIDMAGMTFAVNNVEAVSGQAYKVTEHRSIDNNTPIGNEAALIEIEDVGSDQIRLFFIELAGKSMLEAPKVFPYEGDNIKVSNPTPTDKSAIKLFDEVYQTLSNITGVPTTNTQTRALYESLKTSLPTDKGIDTFSSSQQMAIIKLSYEYCSEMVKSSGLKSAFYGTLNTSQSSSALFNSTIRGQIADSITNKAIGRNIASQPSSNEVATEVNGLISEMINQGKTPDEILRGVCVLGTANMSVLVK